MNHLPEWLITSKMDYSRHMISQEATNKTFPILFEILLQMSAAIVTHMVILLQFQQWEDSQKLDIDYNAPSNVTASLFKLNVNVWNDRLFLFLCTLNHHNSWL